jgi:glycosyltransferase involved in cell wall biosynthesis
MGYSRRKMEWIGNGVDIERFRPNADAALRLRAELGIPAEAQVIGFVGRFHPVKDIPTFLEGAAILLQRSPDVHFVLCGDAVSESLDPEIAAAIDLFPSRAQLHFLPFREDIENVYPLFDVFSLTSVSEAFPMVLLEAMACGIPCVSTDTGDALAIIGETGKVVPTKDSQSLAAAWHDLLELQSDERDLMGNAARNRCRDDFSLSACVARYESVYQQLMTQ